jgi:hypothetical protein
MGRLKSGFGQPGRERGASPSVVSVEPPSHRGETGPEPSQPRRSIAAQPHQGASQLLITVDLQLSSCLHRHTSTSHSSFLVKQLAVDVGPKLLEEKGSRVNANIESPLFSCIAKAALPGGVVETRQTRRRTCTENLTRVEDFSSRVGSGDDRTAQCIASPPHERASAQGIVTRVLTKKGWHHELHHIILTCLIDGSMPKIAAISSRALMKLGSCLGGHRVAREHCWEQYGGVIERVLRRRDKLLLDRLRRQDRVTAHSTKVRDDTKDALGLLWRQWTCHG